jgi:aromatic ring-opening dioxygenase catalytic subunit (LigB family)
MGEVVGAGLIAHVPTIVLPEQDRRDLNHGEDTTLVAGLRQLRREVFDVLDYDTVVVLDSHWATTVEFVVTAQQRRAGLFTSEELPRGMCRRPYDFPGDPSLAHLIASGAMSHTFWPLRKLRDHEAAGPEHIFTPDAYKADMDRIDWFTKGDHATVLSTMPDFYKYKPEARFGHYLMMIGALGEGDCTAAGRQYGEYENSVGTGQVHLWFDRPPAGFPRPRRTEPDPDYIRQTS